MDNNLDFAFCANSAFLHEMLIKFHEDPNSLPQDWRNFFAQNSEDLSCIKKNASGASWSKEKVSVLGQDAQNSSLLGEKQKEQMPSQKDPSKGSSQGSNKDSSQGQVASKSPADSGVNAATSMSADSAESVKLKAVALIESYRLYGHISAKLDPLEFHDGKHHPAVSLARQNLEQSLNDVVSLEKEIGLKSVKVSDLIVYLENLYCGNVGAELSYISNYGERNWLERQFESEHNATLNKGTQERMLNNLIKADAFEQYIHTKFTGAKRFSIEGGDNAINAIEAILETSAGFGVNHVVFGMAHRGRLNVLTNVLGKPYHAVFSEFAGKSSIPSGVEGAGDVKYHLGFSATKSFNSANVYMTLVPNPSHLEAVNSVVMGKVRSQQDITSDKNRQKVMGVLIHGDAAMAGQGSVAEGFAMTALKGYDTGGVVHVVINNQIGFTTDPHDSRSSRYSCDVAKVIECPILHVNGDDAESVYRCATLAAKYRNTFKKDVVLDIVCYRKYGHNEGDEPLYTQPIMYGKIKAKETPAAIYAKKLMQLGVVSDGSYDEMKSSFKSILDSEFDLSKTYESKKADWLEGAWAGVEYKFNVDIQPKTGIELSTLEKVQKVINTFPENFTPNPKIKKQFEERLQIFDQDSGIDWGFAEVLCYGSLLLEGVKVRLSGQDCERGTFSHRHSVVHNAQTGQEYCALNNLSVDQKAFYEVNNSLLSEFAALGFEYGYSANSPNSLTIWEAQFGDFANGGTVIFDQFISAAQSKWLRLCGLVMLLPHGFEGQGPEHSSARIERYLQSCAQNNIIVANCTTPANFFHILRRQVHLKTRRPLVVATPKSLLRHKLAKSKIADFMPGTAFQPIIKDSAVNARSVKRVILTSGKVYYDLLDAREKAGRTNDVAIIRVEQYYPFAQKELLSILKDFGRQAEVVWLQEEPKNMGAYHSVRDYIELSMEECGFAKSRVRYIGRAECASPATGFAKVHEMEQKSIMDEAFGR